MDPLVEAKQAEAAHAAAVAKEAEHRALQVMQDKFIDGIKEALIYPGNDRPALVARIPVICNDIRDIKNDMKWLKWLITGIAGGIGALVIIFLTK